VYYNRVGAGAVVLRECDNVDGVSATLQQQNLQKCSVVPSCWCCTL